jgi:hypothetical protein
VLELGEELELEEVVVGVAVVVAVVDDELG